MDAVYKEKTVAKNKETQERILDHSYLVKDTWKKINRKTEKGGLKILRNGQD